MTYAKAWRPVAVAAVIVVTMGISGISGTGGMSQPMVSDEVDGSVWLDASATTLEHQFDVELHPKRPNAQQISGSCYVVEVTGSGEPLQLALFAEAKTQTAGERHDQQIDVVPDNRAQPWAQPGVEAGVSVHCAAGQPCHERLTLRCGLGTLAAGVRVLLRWQARVEITENAGCARAGSQVDIRKTDRER
jgi:hypothetical protein